MATASAQISMQVGSGPPPVEAVDEFVVAAVVEAVVEPVVVDVVVEPVVVEPVVVEPVVVDPEEPVVVEPVVDVVVDPPPLPLSSPHPGSPNTSSSTSEVNAEALMVETYSRSSRQFNG